jgi:hypothetical protein
MTMKKITNKNTASTEEAPNCSADSNSSKAYRGKGGKKQAPGRARLHGNIQKCIMGVPELQFLVL